MNRLNLAGMETHRTDPLTTAAILHGVDIILHAVGAMFLEQTSTLVVSDLHLEKGSAFARRGYLLPPWDTLATLKILGSVIGYFNPRIIVTLGDNFHDRQGSKLMPAEFRAMIVALARSRDWVWINGNHDPDGPCDLPGISADMLAHQGLVFRHEPSAGLNPGEVSGHLHPSATLRRYEKSVRRPCFASDGSRLVMPSFGVTTGGLDLGHQVFAGLFDRQQLVAHLLGRERVYAVRYQNLRG